MGAACSAPSDAKEARRLEAERRASIPPLTVMVELDGRPAADISVKPYERIGQSMDRDLELEGLDLSVKEAWHGQRQLDVNGSYDDQDVEDGMVLRVVLRKVVLRGHSAYVNAVAALPNGDIVTGSDDNTAIIWNAEGKLKKVMCGHTHSVNDVAVLTNGDIITGSDDNTVVIWSAEGELKQVLSVGSAVSALAALQNGGIVTGLDNTTAIIWSANGEQKRVLRAHTGPVSAVAVLPIGDIVTGSGDKTAIIWSAEGEQKTVLRGHTDYVMAVAGLLDGSIITGSEDNTAIIWSAEGLQKKVLRAYTGSVCTMAVLSNGDVITGSHDNAAIVWSAECKQKRVLRRHTDAISALAVLPNGDIVTGSDDKTAIIWSAPSPSPREQVLHEHSSMDVGIAQNNFICRASPYLGVGVPANVTADSEGKYGLLSQDNDLETNELLRAPSLDELHRMYSDLEPLDRVNRGYSDLLSTEAGLTTDTIRHAFLQEGIGSRDPSAKSQVLSTAQRIWNSRQPTEDPDEKAAHLVLRRTHSALCVDTNGQPMNRRSYSALCAEEIGVPIALVKKVLIVEGREESATPRVLSASQRIWESRLVRSFSMNVAPRVRCSFDDLEVPQRDQSIQAILAACRTQEHTSTHAMLAACRTRN